MRYRRSIIWAAAVGITAAVMTSPAIGAEGAVQLTEVESAAFPSRSWVVSLPSSRDLRASDIDLRENGRRVEDLRLVPGDQAGRRTFGVVLAIDSSESMHGGAIDDAMSAAREFAARRSPNQQLGLLFFNRGQSVALPLTNDPARIEAALAKVPPLQKGTRIYDAGMAAVDMLDRARIRAGSVVMLSDGGDVGSQASAEALATAARRQHARVYTVGLRSPSFDPGTLSDVAASGNGVYSEAGSRSQLRKVYASLGAQLASDYLVSYRSLAPQGTEVQVETRVDGLVTAAVAVYTTPVVSAPAAGAPTTSQADSPTVLFAVMATVLLLLLGAVYLLLRGPRATVRQRIGEYVTPTEPESQTRASAVSAVSAGLERSLRRASWWPRLAEEIEVAGVPMRPGQFIGVTIVSTGALAWLLASIGRPLAAAIFAFAPLAAYLVVRSRAEQRRRQFGDQLADNLQVAASAIRAGHTLAGAMAVVAEDADEPVAGEFRRMVADERLGVSLETAMGTVARRMRNSEMDHVAIVVQLQRESGGNTAEILDHVVDQLRYRGELRRTVRALTAQGKLGGAIVTAMPVAMALMLSLLSPGYLQPMLDSPGGVLALVMSGLLAGVGWLFIRKIVDIKV